ncbi:hypothetical protein F3Y22_tig00112382pilonHSYRG00132 [Hibiscus syriacus]|uniref:Uncharacterized protein n=1 Tax=Hibiscus syriacus TaxID=106335 RepID=A0A6A2WZT6_HIBSY|nr:hypothetical protein F3Y22_tig00112382pilonHSYRG00132 [Hibiscus syriacus]
MDNTDVDNVKPTEECHEVHNVDESDRLVGQLFCSRDQAWYFYKGFVREHGFSARKGTTRLDVEGNVKTQEFCCSKEGFRVSKVNTVDRQHAHMPVTRTGCKARVVVTATNTNDQWVISKSDQKHNHALCTPAMTPFMRSNRAAGGYHNVGFTHKDLYNALQRDESGALYNLIWSDSTSRSDYTCFGDVIAFDTTYKDNLYGRPIMPIVGVNHHHNTIVFATAIIADETSQSFEWVLQNFLEAMMNKSPISVVTNGDRAMQRAIKSVIPYAKHRLCSWHISRNAQANIGDPKFTAAFSKCMASWWTTKEFDIQWRSVVSEFNVQKHPWTVGLPCHRQLHILKHLDYTYFPGTLIQSRWTNDAKASAPSYVDLNVSPEVMQMARFTALRSMSSRLCYIASKTDESFKTARDEMKKLIEELENSFGLNYSVNQSIVVNNVRDPQRKQRKQKEVPKNKVEKKIR